MDNQAAQNDTSSTQSSGGTTQNFATFINNATGTTIHDGAFKVGINNMGGQNNDNSGQIGMQIETKKSSGDDGEKGNVTTLEILPF